MAFPRCEVHQLGCVPYAQALTLQHTWTEARSTAAGVDRLALLEHPHTYTLGSAGQEANLLMPPETRVQLGIEVYRTDRGGDITYHGPGQVVGYPIMQLADFQRGSVRADVVGYVRRIEALVIAVLADYGIDGMRIDGLTGVWVDTPHGEAKIAAIGVRVNVRGVTKHGFALNVHPDLAYFQGIIPCGIEDKGVTSMAALLGHIVPLSDIHARLITHFGVIFEREMVLAV
ncbi:MAG: lipoyl(octanoyl) transferase LipB [bacterium]|nr:lipoyl(octanoyl) transferase LipB [bacterium]